jgi:hypothetical protein
MNIVKIVDENCMKAATTDESKAFFYKMIGDYYRYVAEAPKYLEEVKSGALNNYN